MVNRRLLVVFYRSEPQLWELEISSSCVARLITDKVVAGDATNLARFFSQRYFERRPIEQLQFLAAHLILMGHALNPLMIGGLEILICKQGSQAGHLAEDEVRDLREKSRSLDEQIRERLMAARM